MAKDAGNRENYEVREQIGKGAFGAAFLVVDKETKQEYVLKRVRLARQSQWQRQSTLQEMELVSSFQHPFIVPHIDSWVQGGHTVNIVYGYCERGDLGTLLHKQKSAHFDEAQLKLWLVELLLALDHVHSNKVLHRDIKCSNVFLTAAGDVQLGDFGLATFRGTGDHTEDQSLVGTPCTMSPELLGNKGYSFKSDVWSLGCVIYELSALKPPFNAFNIQGLIDKIKKTKPAPITAGYSPEWLALINRMLHKSPERRPSVQQLLRSPVLADAVATTLSYVQEAMPGCPIPDLDSRPLSPASRTRTLSADSCGSDPPASPLHKQLQRAASGPVVSTRQLPTRGSQDEDTDRWHSSGADAASWQRSSSSTGSAGAAAPEAVDAQRAGASRSPGGWAGARERPSSTQQGASTRPAWLQPCKADSRAARDATPPRDVSRGRLRAHSAPQPRASARQQPSPPPQLERSPYNRTPSPTAPARRQHGGSGGGGDAELSGQATRPHDTCGPPGLQHAQQRVAATCLDQQRSTLPAAAGQAAPEQFEAGSTAAAAVLVMPAAACTEYMGKGDAVSCAHHGAATCEMDGVESHLEVPLLRKLTPAGDAGNETTDCAVAATPASTAASSTVWPPLVMGGGDTGQLGAGGCPPSFTGAALPRASADRSTHAAASTECLNAQPVSSAGPSHSSEEPPTEPGALLGWHMQAILRHLSSAVGLAQQAAAHDGADLAQVLQEAAVCEGSGVAAACSDHDNALRLLPHLLQQCSMDRALVPAASSSPSATRTPPAAARPAVHLAASAAFITQREGGDDLPPAAASMETDEASGWPPAAATSCEATPATATDGEPAPPVLHTAHAPAAATAVVPPAVWNAQQHKFAFLQRVLTLVARLCARQRYHELGNVLSSPLLVSLGVVPASPPTAVLGTGPRASGTSGGSAGSIGDFVFVGSRRRMQGVIRYYGPTHWDDGEDDWVGLQFEEPVPFSGKTNGTVGGVRYFDAAPQCGLFVKASTLKPEQDKAK